MRGQGWMMEKVVGLSGYRALDLKSAGRGFKSCSDHQLVLFHGRPELNCLTSLVNSQVVCLLPVGVIIFVMFNLNYFFLNF